MGGFGNCNSSMAAYDICHTYFCFGLWQFKATKPKKIAGYASSQRDYFDCHPPDK
jgi:hypothetical protein